MNFSDIEDILYKRYHVAPSPSKVTSSHWREYGSLISVTRDTGSYAVRGSGFGFFIPRCSIKAIRFLLRSIFAQALLRKFSVDAEIVSAGKEIARRTGRVMDFDCVKQVLTVDLLSKKGVLSQAKTVVVIGDGYGYMTSLLQLLFPHLRVIAVNLGNVLFFDVFSVHKALPEVSCYLWETGSAATLPGQGGCFS